MASQPVPNAHLILNSDSLPNVPPYARPSACCHVVGRPESYGPHPRGQTGSVGVEGGDAL